MIVIAGVVLGVFLMVGCPKVLCGITAVILKLNVPLPFALQGENESTAIRAASLIRQSREGSSEKSRKISARRTLGQNRSLFGELDQHRISHADPNFGRSFERGLIWDELLDLELQEFNEKMMHLSKIPHRLTHDILMKSGGGPQQQPRGQTAPSGWRRLSRFFR